MSDECPRRLSLLFELYAGYTTVRTSAPWLPSIGISLLHLIYRTFYLHETSCACSGRVSKPLQVIEYEILVEPRVYAWASNDTHYVVLYDIPMNILCVERRMEGSGLSPSSSGLGHSLLRGETLAIVICAFGFESHWGHLTHVGSFAQTGHVLLYGEYWLRVCRRWVMTLACLKRSDSLFPNGG